MTSRTAETSAPILPVLADRWSPRSMDANHEISDQDLLSLVEAGRWAPSAMNVQPWRFSVAKRGSELFGKIVSHLGGFNSAWSPRCSAYVVVSAFTNGDKDQPGSTSQFDAGLATAQILIQAEGLGLKAHVMGGIDHVALHTELGYPENLGLLVVVAIGKGAPAELLEGGAYDREVAARTRLPLNEIVLHGLPNAK
ncbi:nitroreductase family protein [Rhodoluna lacicola]|uniref:Nitroreductase n=1 Tax=Rhodoluna lacicola TaxID=529884 RepID=A0A060JPE6_9MICO|nr:nitroreductase family protein [Rhodoluna lacicola]AIC48054.1 Nitroreductase [Rhodoluna lacicola]